MQVDNEDQILEKLKKKKSAEFLPAPPLFTVLLILLAAHFLMISQYREDACVLVLHIW